jgi:cell division inhibitor SepF
MAGAMRKMAVYLGLVEDEDEVYDDYPDEEPTARYPRDAAPVPRSEVPARPLRSIAEHPTATVVTAPQVRASLRPDTDASYRITTVCPHTYNDAKVIGENYRQGTPVIMNLTEMDDEDAKRLVDFAAGLVFGLFGQIEKVTNKVFLLTPANVEVTAEDKQRIAQGGFFNQS